MATQKNPPYASSNRSLLLSQHSNLYKPSNGRLLKRHYVENHSAGLDNQELKRSMARLKAFSRLYADKKNIDSTDDLPMWVQNRKLLVRVFIIWLMVLGYTLFCVFSNTTT